EYLQRFAAEPDPIESEAPCVEQFPVEVFPPDLRRYCLEVATATGTPPDFAALIMLVVAGAAIGGSRAISVKKGWNELPALYAFIVGSVALGKSPVMRLVLEPYRSAEIAAIRAYAADKAAYDDALAESARTTP